MSAILWFILLVVFIFVEVSTVTMVSIWFVAGALAAMIVSFLNGQFWLQIVVFLAVSAVLLICLRPVTKKFLTPKIVKTNVDSVIGMQGRVTAAIDNVEAKGQVKLGAMEWSARSTDGSPIKKDAVVTVDRIEGVKVFVSPVKEEVLN